MIGTQVGPFTVVSQLGEGGMGSVYLAEHAVLRMRRAIKFLSPQLIQHPEAVQRFLNEARTLAQLHHRNVIQVHDVGQLASGAWFMVLDHLEGDTLAQVMARHAGAMPPHAIVHILAEVANGLERAHRHRIVHRDLKPENVVVIARDGDPHRAVVLDFGVAQRADDPGAGLATLEGVALGTPAYMALEQLRGDKVGPVADVFALGVIAYQMTTGGWFPHQHGESRAGYCALSTTELYHRQRSGPPIDPRERWPGLSAAWVDAILAAVSSDPAARPASAAAFALRLADAVPPSAQSPGGRAIVRSVARELVEPSEIAWMAPGDPGDRSEPSDRGGQRDANDPGDRTGQRDPSGRSAARDGAGRAEPQVGLGSRYQLGDKLGIGGMAEVFAGTMIGAEGFARPVAIKRVLSGLSQVPAFAAMFVTEAQIASRLSHPNIVSVLDFNRDPEDRLFLVMEYIDGTDLASLLEAGPIAPGLALFIAVEMLRALGYAHDVPDLVHGSRGVIHRDVSPQNLLLSRAGAVKLSDFGLAKVRAASGGAWSDAVRGKPSYMSPEQCGGEPLDGRSDLFSAGVMLWEMLAHRPLFTGAAREIMAQVMFRDVRPPSAVMPGVPGDLEAVAMVLLSRDRDARYPTAQAAIEALLGCRDVPRDGRSELAHLLAVRFPRSPGLRSRGAWSAAAAPRAQEPPGSGPPGPRPAPGAAAPRQTQASQPMLPAPRDPRRSERTPSSDSVDPAGAEILAPRPEAERPRRSAWPATMSGAVVGCVAVAIAIAGGDIARSGTPAQRAARTALTAPALGPRARPEVTVDARPAPATPPGPGAPGADPASVMPGATAGSALVAPAAPVAPARPPAGAQHRGPPARTGELAIIVEPWAMIWLNGKPRGQTPFRAPVPAGRYRVRLANDVVDRDEVVAITVEPDRTTTIERTW
jgi:serine/threonine-protein kinase